MIILFTIFLLFCLTAFYKYYVRPYRQIKRLTQQFTDKGLKVFTFPYNLFNLPIYKTILRDGQAGDPYTSFKTKFVSYDLIIGNIMALPAVMVLSPTCRK